VQTTHQTAHGQLLDITTAPIGTVDLSKYTEETYMRIVTFKTAFYSFYLPVVCGLLVGGVNNEAAFATAKDICIQMGQYFQVHAMQANVLFSIGMYSSDCFQHKVAAAVGAARGVLLWRFMFL
jgi:hypothetical protein